MANESTTTTLAGAIANTVVPAVLEGYDELVIVPRTNVKTLGQGQGTTAQWPLLPRTATADITEGSAVSNTAFSISSATATIAEHGVLIALTDIARTASTVSVAEIVAALMRRNMEAMDAKVVALFPAVQGGSGAINTDGSDIVADDVLSAAALLAAGVRGKMVTAHQDLTLALNPGSYYRILNDLQNNGAALNSTDLMRGIGDEGRMPRLFGIPVAVTSQADKGDTGGAGTGSYQNCLFHRDCFGTAIQRMVDVREEVKAEVGGGRGSLFQVSFVAGFTELRDDFGVVIEDK